MSDPREFLFDDRPPTGEPPIPHKPIRTAEPGQCRCIRFGQACLNKADQEDMLCSTCRPACYKSRKEADCFRDCYGPRCNYATHGGLGGIFSRKATGNVLREQMEVTRSALWEQMDALREQMDE